MLHLPKIIKACTEQKCFSLRFSETEESDIWMPLRSCVCLCWLKMAKKIQHVMSLISNCRTHSFIFGSRIEVEKLEEASIWMCSYVSDTVTKNCDHLWHQLVTAALIQFTLVKKKEALLFCFFKFLFLLEKKEVYEHSEYSNTKSTFKWCPVLWMSFIIAR